MTNTNQAACMVDIPMNNYSASLALRGAEKTFYIIFQYRHGQHYMLKNCTCNV